MRLTVTSEPKLTYIQRNLNVIKFSVKDDSGVGKVSIFNQPYAVKNILQNETYYFYGLTKRDQFGFSMTNPSFSKELTLPILPVYKQTKGLSNKKIISVLQSALSVINIEETLSQRVLQKYNLCDLNTAILNVHRPKDMETLKQAQYRLSFEELLYLLLVVHMKNKNDDAGIVLQDCVKEFTSLLPHTPTNAQQRVLLELAEDFSKTRCANRLLQGDVGSGKTLIAQYCLFAAAKSGYQAAFMAPTEVLATQHFHSTKKLFKGTGIETALLTGSTPATERKAILEGAKNGDIHILIGTHALFYKSLAFKELAVVVTDEQHRFGVMQRKALSNKGSPHKLIMSATPIPRTLAKMLYGGLSISVLDELPAGRLPIKTKLVGEHKRHDMYTYIKEQVDNGTQAYVVCPKIEGDEMGKSAQEVFTELKKIFKDNVALIHSKLKNDTKQQIFQDFYDGKIGVLVATTVIEVGLDVKNATIVVIEDAHMFGLSQLHQLRGRVGRGRAQSWCFLVSNEENERLNVLVSSTDGFYIAKQDLLQRGPGEFLGTAQNGVGDLYFRHLINDNQLMEETREALSYILENPQEFNRLRDVALARFGE